MKIYISVDLEGVACVTDWADIKLEGQEYEQARKWMTAETNAAVEGALAAGATEVVVADSHGDMRNLLPDELHEDVLLVRGCPRAEMQMSTIDGTFDAVFLVGYHPMEGAAPAVWSHTMVGLAVNAVRLNGVTVGESAISAAIAGHYGVPVALVCGDDCLEAEAAAFLPWTERVITKWSLGFQAARSLTPKASQKRIREGAERALRRISEMRPFIIETPIRLEVDLKRPRYADPAADIPGVERLNGRSLAYSGADMLEVVRVLRLMINASMRDFYV